MGRKACVATADVSKITEVQHMIETSVKELGDLNTMYGAASTMRHSVMVR